MKSVTGCYSYAPSGSVVAKTFSIGNALYYGRKYEMEINGGECLKSNSVKAHYPFPWSEISMSLPAFDWGTVLIATDDYNNWGTILHEYGHTIEDKLDIFVGYDEFFSPGYMFHDPVANLSEFYNGNKKKALEISWNEGWASYYSLCVRRKYNLGKYPGAQLGHIMGLDAESDSWYGEDNEMAVAAVLYNVLLDELLTEQEMWDILVANRPTNFAGFVALLEDRLVAGATLNGTISAKEINCFYEILETQNMSAKRLEYEYKGTTFAPTFTWKEPTINMKDGNDFVAKFKYNLVIISYNGTYEYVSPTITENAYTPSAKDWAMILDACPNGFYWTIKTTESHEPSSDGYCSQLIEMKDSKLYSVASNSRYEEDVVSLGENQIYVYKIVFEASGNKVIQTFGELDTCLELYTSDGKLIMKWNDTDDEGYQRNALISYNFSADTVYFVRVRLYDEEESGKVKIAIMPTYHHDSYDDAYGTYGITTVSWSLSNDRVALFRYQFGSAGNVTFTMSSSTNTDTYLYIIDPASTAEVVRYNGSNYGNANLYDDDSGEGLQAQLTKSVVANKEYLVIISFYNPHTMSGKFAIKTSQ